MPDTKYPDGWGRMDYYHGTRYIGQWSHGVREGCGALYTRGHVSSIYHGEWRQDLQTGWGVIRYSTGVEYRGQWVNNKYHGYGVMTWSNGDKYQGPFTYGQMHGVKC